MTSLHLTSTDSATIPEVDTSIVYSILLDEQVLDIITQTKFLSDWDTLYEDCPWGTVFQSKEFVCSWYRLYHTSYVPIIVKAEKKSRLVGLLTLTGDTERRLMTAAGIGIAEYQTWLTSPGFGEIFIKEAMSLLQLRFPTYEINLYNATPGTPLEWTRNPYWYKRCIVKSLRRPLMDLKDPEVPKLFRKKQFREKTNRLKRLGNLSFQKVTDTAQFNSILDEIAIQSDFRKGAKFNHSEFKHDSARRQFLLELFEKGILHTTILKLDNDIIASIAACAGRGSVHLAGLNTYSPLLARYSPGTINFIMLGQILMEEGIDLFDLTPGGDPYKERLATSHDYVHDIYINSKANTLYKRKIKAPLEDSIKLVLNRCGITPRILKNNFTKVKERIALAKVRNSTDLLSIPYLIKGIAKKKKVIKYISINSTSSDSPSLNFSVNSLQELLLYNQKEGFVIQWDFLEDAMQRFENGETVYTLIEEGILIFVAWVNTQFSDKHDQSLSSTDRVNIDLIFCHKHTSSRLLELLRNVAKIANSDSETIQCSMESTYEKYLQPEYPGQS